MLIMLPIQACLHAQAPFHPEMAKEKAISRILGPYEIGAFAKPQKGSKFGKTLYRQRFPVNKTESTYQFVVDEVPDKAGIDPFHLLIDRTPDDNTKSVDLKSGG